jgi:hypothetical protein
MVVMVRETVVVEDFRNRPAMVSGSQSAKTRSGTIDHEIFDLRDSLTFIR